MKIHKTTPFPHLLINLVLLCLLAPASYGATEVDFPADAPVWNVKDYGAVGNGIADDTQAFKDAITAALDHNQRYTAIRIIYVPNGTYKITGTLNAKNLNNTGFSNGWRAGFFMQGESEAGTILKLPNNASGFTNVSSPKAVIRTGSENPTNTGGGDGNQAFRHYIRNLTVDVGSGNAGAVGIDFLSNNRGGIYNVTVKSSDANHIGHTGIRMDRAWPGPGIVKDVTVDGFKYGISMWNHYQYSMTFEHIILRNQTTYGFRMKNNTANIRGLTSENTVTAIYVESNQAHLTVIDANLTGGSSSTPAIDNKAPFYGRNITTAGYSKAIEDKNTKNRDINTNGTIDEYMNRGANREYSDSIDGSIRLPVKETPEYNSLNFSNWAKASNSASDDLASIQAAIDSGKEIVYLPQGDYKVSDTIIIRNNVKKIIGLCAGISKTSGFPSGKPIIRFDGTSSSNTIIQYIRFFGDVEHNSNKTLAIVNSDISNAKYYNTANGTGDLFVEDCIFERLVANHPQDIFARQLNMEFASDTFLVNNGGKAWLFGYKTEGKNGTPLHNKNGGWMEVFGGFFYPQDGGPSVPMIINENANLSVNYKKNGGNNYSIHVQDIRGGTTQNFWNAEAYNNDNTDLYSGATSVYTSGGGTTDPDTLPPSDDAYVRDGSHANSNYGGLAELIVKDTNVSGYDRRSYLEFDLSSMTGDADTAELVLILKSIASSPATINLYEVDDDSWSEGSITWNNKPAPGSLIQSITLTSADVGNEIAIDVKSFVNAERSVNDRASFVFTQPGAADNAVKFHSKDAASDKPVLEINGGSGSSGGGGNTAPLLDDAYVRGGTNSSNNYGGSTVLAVKDASNNTYDRRSYLKFDLSGMSADTSLAELVLTLKSMDSSSSGVELRKVSDDSWTEGAVTWNDKPLSGDLIQSFTLTTADIGNELAIDVTSYVNAERSNDGEVSFILRQQGVADVLVEFHSSDAVSGGPVLEVGGSSGGAGDIIVEAEDLSRTSGGAGTSVITDSAASGGEWVKLNADGVGDWLEFTVPNVEVATYDISVEYRTHSLRGQYQTKVVWNGGSANIGSVNDQYTASGNSYLLQVVGLHTFTSAGSKRLRFEVTGKNSGSSGYSLSIDKIRMIKQ